MKKKFLSLALILMMMLTACTPKVQEEKKEEVKQEETKTEEKKAGEEKVFTLGGEQFASNLDPTVEWSGWYTVRYGIGETLFKINDSLEVEPWLAKEYKNIDDKTWEITLKDGIKFSNGKELTSDMVIKNLQKVAEANERAGFLKDAEMKAEGNKITIKTASPRATLINDLADPYACIINLDDTTDFNNGPIGTGPYKIVRFEEGKEAEMVPNTNYWNGSPKVSKVIVKKIMDKETGALALKNGEIDAFIELNPQSYQTFKDDSNFVAQSLSTSRVFSAYYNTNRLTDVNLRNAIHLAIDKKSIAEFLVNGAMTPGETAFPDSTAYGTSKLKTESFDLEKAKKLLEESGYKDTNADGILEKDGKDVEIEIKYYARLSIEQIATELQATLTKLGIKASVVKVDNTEDLAQGNFDIGFYSMITTPNGDPGNYLEGLMKKDGVINFNKFEYEGAEELLKELEKEHDPAKRAKIAVELQQKVYDNHTVEYFGFNNLNAVVRKGVDGFKAHTADYYHITADLDVK